MPVTVPLEVQNIARTTHFEGAKHRPEKL
jgi:hypothetical protein